MCSSSHAFVHRTRDGVGNAPGPLGEALADVRITCVSGRIQAALTGQPPTTAPDYHVAVADAMLTRIRIGTRTECRGLCWPRWRTKPRCSCMCGLTADTGPRSVEATIFSILRRLWIGFIVIAVMSAGGFAVSRLQTIFGSEKPQTYADTDIVDTAPFNPKHLTYEVFGAPGTVASISYLDAEADPQYVKQVLLPWSLDLTINHTSAVGSLMAQGDSGEIGCRIAVDGQVKTERTSNKVNAFTSCELKSA